MLGSDILIEYFQSSQWLYPIGIAGALARDGRCDRKKSQVRCEEKASPISRKVISVLSPAYLRHGFLYIFGLAHYQFSILNF